MYNKLFESGTIGKVTVIGGAGLIIPEIEFEIEYR